MVFEFHCWSEAVLRHIIADVRPRRSDEPTNKRIFT